MTPVSDLKIDGGIPNRLERAAEAARALERDGYDGGWTAETNHDPFLPLLLAAEHTSRLELGTNIAVAFARNPMICAQIAQDLQRLSRGRFVLGLGTQVKPHIERRFSQPWSRPVARMREFVQAIRAIWSCWNGKGRLDFRGEFRRSTWRASETRWSRWWARWPTASSCIPSTRSHIWRR